MAKHRRRRGRGEKTLRGRGSRGAGCAQRPWASGGGGTSSGLRVARAAAAAIPQKFTELTSDACARSPTPREHGEMTKRRKRCGPETAFARGGPRAAPVGVWGRRASPRLRAAREAAGVRRSRPRRRRANKRAPAQAKRPARDREAPKTVGDAKRRLKDDPPGSLPETPDVSEIWRNPGDDLSHVKKFHLPLPINAVSNVLEELGDVRDHQFSIDYTQSAAFVRLTECVFEALVCLNLLDPSAHARTAEFVRLRKGGQHISSLAVTGFKNATSPSSVVGYHTTEHLHALGVVQVSLRGGRWWRTRRRTPEEDGGSPRATRLWREGPDELGVPGTFRVFEALFLPPSRLHEAWSSHGAVAIQTYVIPQTLVPVVMFASLSCFFDWGSQSTAKVADEAVSAEDMRPWIRKWAVQSDRGWGALL